MASVKDGPMMCLHIKCLKSNHDIREHNAEATRTVRETDEVFKSYMHL